MSPVQVWDLAAGKLVRLFEGKGQWCYSMVNLQDERIAVGWYTGTCVAVDVIATSTGKLLQQLTGFSGYIYGLALVDDHLLIVCDDKTLRVWSQDAAGKVRRPREWVWACFGERKNSVVRAARMCADRLACSLVRPLPPITDFLSNNSLPQVCRNGQVRDHWPSTRQDDRALVVHRRYL